MVRALNRRFSFEMQQVSHKRHSMRLVTAVLLITMLVPQGGCGRVLSAIFKSADNAAADAASRGGRSAGDHPIDAPAPRGGDDFGGDSFGVRLDGGSYWLTGTARRVSSDAVRATLRQHGYSSSGSEDIDEESRREIAAYRLSGHVSYTASTCWDSVGEPYVVPRHATHCLDGSSPSLEYEIDLSVISVQ
jgi:hypothetical protein